MGLTKKLENNGIYEFSLTERANKNTEIRLLYSFLKQTDSWEVKDFVEDQIVAQLKKMATREKAQADKKDIFCLIQNALIKRYSDDSNDSNSVSILSNGSSFEINTKNGIFSIHIAQHATNKMLLENEESNAKSKKRNFVYKLK